MDEFTTHCMELLSPLGLVRANRMFGGRGLYIDEIFVAIIASEQLYLKVSADTRPVFEAAGCMPMRYRKAGEWHEIAYFSAPEEAMESPALMLPWARHALAAALAARVRTPAKKSAKAG